MENLGKVIDQIRRNRNITIESLCDGIISHSTYSRFVNGKTTVASDSFIKLVSRLHMTLAMFLQDYQGFFKLKHDYAILNYAKNNRDIAIIEELITTYSDKKSTNKWKVFDERFLKVAKVLHYKLNNKRNRKNISSEIEKIFTSIKIFSDNDYIAFRLILDYLSIDEAEAIISPQLECLNIEKVMTQIESIYYVAGNMYLKALIEDRNDLASYYYSIVANQKLDQMDLSWKLKHNKYTNIHLYFTGDKLEATEELEKLREFYVDLNLELEAKELTRISHELGIQLKDKGNIL